MSTLIRDTSRHKESAYWSGVFAMTLCIFVLIASEFMPVSLLTPVAGDLGVTEGMAGQGIAISGALAVLTSLTMSSLAGNINRKYLLLGMTLLMAVSGAIIAMAPGYMHLNEQDSQKNSMSFPVQAMSICMTVRI